MHYVVAVFRTVTAETMQLSYHVTFQAELAPVLRMLNAPDDTELIAPKTSTHNSHTQSSETQKLKTHKPNNSKPKHSELKAVHTMSFGPRQCSSCLTSAYALPDAPVWEGRGLGLRNQTPKIQKLKTQNLKTQKLKPHKTQNPKAHNSKSIHYRVLYQITGSHSVMILGF